MWGKTFFMDFTPSVPHGACFTALGVRQQQGFSLVEVLVGVAIALILVVLLIPAMGVVQDRAAVAQCVANLRQIGQGYSLYAQEHSQCLPPYYDPPEAGGLYATVEPLELTAHDFLSPRGIYRCPSGVKAMMRTTDNPWLWSTYHQNRRWRSFWNSPTERKNLNTFTNPSKAVLVYEQWGPDDQPPLSPDTHSHCRNMLYVDLHVESRSDLVTQAELDDELTKE